MYSEMFIQKRPQNDNVMKQTLQNMTRYLEAEMREAAGPLFQLTCVCWKFFIIQCLEGKKNLPKITELKSMPKEIKKKNLRVCISFFSCTVNNPFSYFSIKPTTF